MSRLSRLLPASVLACACLSSASPTAAAQFVAAKITFRNPGPYTQEELQRTCMLLTGEHTGTPGIQAATQRLMDTGYFDDVKVDTKGTRESLEVIFILKPNPPGHSTKVGFENFVWLTAGELHAAVHAATPLFRGELPEAGNQPDLINAALQSALAAKGVTARVVHETLEPSTTQPVRAVEYRVEPAVKIGSITLRGVPPELTPAEDKITQRLSGLSYNEGLAGDTTASYLLAPSQNAGYLDARLNDLQRTLSPAGKVDITAILEPGPVYHVAAVNFEGTPVIQQAAVMSTAKLHPGDIASHEMLLLTMLPIDEAYKKQGYMDVYVDPGQTLDTTAHTASYTFTVVPGEIYRLHSVTPLGLSPAARADFDRARRIKPGDVYNADYVTHFIENNSALPNLATYTATFEAIADPNTHLVELTIKFVPNGAPAHR